MENSAADKRPDSRNVAPAIKAAKSILGAELLAELQRRSAAYRNRETSTRPAAEVLAQLRRRQTGETIA